MTITDTKGRKIEVEFTDYEIKVFKSEAHLSIIGDQHVIKIKPYQNYAEIAKGLGVSIEKVREVKSPSIPISKEDYLKIANMFFEKNGKGLYHHSTPTSMTDNLNRGQNNGHYNVYVGKNGELTERYFGYE